MVDARDDGRVLLSPEETPSGPIVILKYILLNPAERFKEVVDQARSVVLAGGTMEPVCPSLKHISNSCSSVFEISDFLKQLFPIIPSNRFSTLSCAHVIPKSNLLTQVICRGPRKVEFEFKFANRGDDMIVSLRNQA